MKIVRKEQTNTHKNSENCIATEYPLGDKDIDMAVIEITGRYPTKGRVVNNRCKELAYVINGKGRVIIEGKEFNVKEGDMILIEPEEKYYWDGNFTLFVPCTPAWYPEQHEEVD